MIADTPADTMDISEDESEDASDDSNALAIVLVNQPSVKAEPEPVPTLVMDLGTLLSTFVHSDSMVASLKPVSAEALSSSAPTSLIMDTLKELKKENEVMNKRMDKQDQTNLEIKNWMVKQEESASEIKNLLMALVTKRS